MPLTDLLKIIRKNISPKQQNALPNGLICLKGGELERETMPVKNKTTMWNLKEFFGEELLREPKRWCTWQTERALRKANVVL